MPVICWGPLAKSADDPTTISEYIAGKILDHNVNPSSHSLDGYAIFNHRDAPVLDHLPYSIDSDKYIYGSIPYSAFSNTDLQFYTNFETFDGWLIESWVGTIFTTPGPLGAYVGKAFAPASEVELSFGSSGPGLNFFDQDKNYYFKFMGKSTIGSVNGTGYVGPLAHLISEDTFLGFGLKFTSTKVYLAISDPSEDPVDEHLSELVGITPTDVHVYEVTYNADNKTFIVLIDGVEFINITADNKPPSCDAIWAFVVREDANTAANIGMIQLYISVPL